ncbi:2-C-methyl-D-erythritol 4-phosphate cytidylyltransferase [Zafaria sp. Z1313]|uniref:2-C-methyl-D-erythritol 4-phosphate cytidylyltransferase n=1 Tax=Zafaria sp. Z1313 TaxID=3423202 RepID=UPI003D30382A
MPTPAPTVQDAATAGGTAVVLVAAGSGTRLGAGVPKALAPVAGRPMLAHALDGVLAALPGVPVVVVIPPDDARLAEVCAPYARDGVVCLPGGSTRHASVRAGLEAVPAGTRHVLVHDAARCFAPAGVHHAVLAALRDGAEAVVPALPVVDTIKEAAPGPDGAEYAASTPDRSVLRAVQTPQGFALAPLLAAHATAAGWDEAASAAVTDDALLMERLGHRVRIVPGAPEALKITTPLDLAAAEALAARPDPRRPPLTYMTPSGPVLPRTGLGVDVHAFAPDGEERPLWLAGLNWPGERGLSGHSDGDAVAHAACDALFSAAGIGDLGTHFGTDRPEFAGASGATLLAEAARLVRAAGYGIGNVAVQFVGNRPKFGPRRQEADAALTAAAGAPVTVTATTSDRLGYEGEGQGITAYATALVYPAAGGPRA